MRIAMSITVVLIALVGIGASINHYLTTPYNSGFLDYPVVTAIHVILGAFYLSFGLFQFVGKIRTRWLNYHRYMGRVLFSIGLVIGVTAFFIGIVFPFSGWQESIIISIFSVLFTLFLIKGFMAIRAKDMKRHREWMIRAFAIGLAIGTMRVIFGTSISLTGPTAVVDFQVLSNIAFLVAFISHSLVAEMWIRKTRI